MIYILFFTLVIAALMAMSIMAGKLFLMLVMISVIISTVVTMTYCAITENSRSVGDALRSSMLSLIAIGLITIFTFQTLLKQSPSLFLLYPVAAFIAAITATRHILSVPPMHAAIIWLINGSAIYLLFRTKLIALIGP